MIARAVAASLNGRRRALAQCLDWPRRLGHPSLRQRLASSDRSTNCERRYITELANQP